MTELEDTVRRSSLALAAMKSMTAWEACCHKPCPLCLVWGWHRLPCVPNRPWELALFRQRLLHMVALGRIWHSAGSCTLAQRQLKRSSAAQSTAGQRGTGL